MINISKTIFFILLITGCSGLQDPEEAFLQTIRGSWTTTEEAVGWFLSKPISVIVDEGTPVTVASDGSFTIIGVDFTFIEIEQTGVLAVYRVEIPFTPPTIVFTGIGFNSQNNVVITPTVFASPSLVVPPNPLSGIFFLK